MNTALEYKLKKILKKKKRKRMVLSKLSEAPGMSLKELQESNEGDAEAWCCQQ